LIDQEKGEYRSERNYHLADPVVSRVAAQEDSHCDHRGAERDDREGSDDELAGRREVTE
jgi:hypothetical protein